MTSSALPTVLWHASRANIERPTIANRTEGDNHANSGLGLWCATGPHDYIAGFGATVFALTLVPNARVKEMSLSELVKLGRDESREWFDALGREWSQSFDVVSLVERTGEACQAIVLNDAAIASVKRFTQEAFLAEHAQAWSFSQKTKPPRP